MKGARSSRRKKMRRTIEDKGPRYDRRLRREWVSLIVRYTIRFEAVGEGYRKQAELRCLAVRQAPAWFPTQRKAAPAPGQLLSSRYSFNGTNRRPHCGHFQPPNSLPTQVIDPRCGNRSSMPPGVGETGAMPGALARWRVEFPGRRIN